MSPTRDPAPPGRVRSGRRDGRWTLTRRRAAVVLVLLSLSVLAGAWQDFTLYYLFHQADLGYVVQGGARIAAGQMPYRDFIFMWPPVTPLLMAASFRLCGLNLWAAKLPLVGFVAAALPLAYRWLRGSMGRSGALAGTAAVWVATVPIALRLPYATAFTLAPAFFLFTQLDRLRPGRLVGPAWWAGVACGLTLGLKHNVGLLLGLAIWVQLLCTTPYTALAPTSGHSRRRPWGAALVRALACAVAVGGLVVLYRQFRQSTLTAFLTLGPAAVYTLAGSWAAWRRDAVAPEAIAWRRLGAAVVAVGCGTAALAAPWLVWLAQGDALDAFLRIGLIRRDATNDWGVLYAQLLRLPAAGRTGGLLALAVAGSVAAVFARRRAVAWAAAAGAVVCVAVALALDGLLAGQRAWCYAPLTLYPAWIWFLRRPAGAVSRAFAMTTGAAWYVALGYPAATGGHLAIGYAPAVALAIGFGWDARHRHVHAARVGLGAMVFAVAAFGWLEWSQAMVRRTDAGWQWHAPARIPGPRGGTWTAANMAQNLTAIAAQVDQWSPPGAPLVAWPAHGLLNFYTNRPNPTRMDYYWPGYLNAEAERTLLAQLAAATPPTVVLCGVPDPVFGDGLLWRAHPALREYIETHYFLIGTSDLYQLYVRLPGEP